MNSATVAEFGDYSRQCGQRIAATRDQCMKYYWRPADDWAHISEKFK